MLVTVVGLITEYNPFHLGHLAQLQAIRDQLNPEVLVVLMSGNVVQRGDFAVLDKWARARLALDAGADLVVEQALTATLQSADYFASRNVQSMSQLGVDCLVFGSEVAGTQDLEALAQLEAGHQALFDRCLQTLLKQGLSYASSYQQALAGLPGYQDLGFDPSQPNHLLNIQYYKSNQKLARPMKLYSLPRYQRDGQGREILSGSQIRQQLQQNGGELERLQGLPGMTLQALAGQFQPSISAYFPYLKYQCLVLGPKGLAQIQGMKEGFEVKVYQEISQAQTFQDLEDRLTSKRWSRASIRRLLMMVLLGISQADWEEELRRQEEAPLLRLLAFSPEGRAYLNQQRDHLGVILMSNYRQNLVDRYVLTIKASQIQDLLSDQALLDREYRGYPQTRKSLEN
ncbi:nucleotidyltransferase family protein [Hutsoniella sourekii]|uniref:nucleotidyltransferase family protein n=1 Tax=Hutsoniella sourekii TaxID=87650 RepID=UPI0009FE92BC|nr:nucleotidyltransferase family protein [Hutsoniella sourekii]